MEKKKVAVFVAVAFLIAEISLIIFGIGQSLFLVLNLGIFVFLTIRGLRGSFTKKEINL